MSFTAALASVILLLSVDVALLIRFQWLAFKKRLSRQMLQQLAIQIECELAESDRPQARNFIVIRRQ
jgi:hypothetical protein